MTKRAVMTLSPAQKIEVETLAAVLNAEQIADYFGIGRTTFYSMMKRDDEIEERYKKGKARAIGAIAQTLIQKARSGDTTSMIFYLKTQAGWRETALIEHGGSITANVETEQGAAQLDNFLTELGRRMRAEAEDLVIEASSGPMAEIGEGPR